MLDEHLTYEPAAIRLSILVVTVRSRLPSLSRARAAPTAARKFCSDAAVLRRPSRRVLRDDTAAQGASRVEAVLAMAVVGVIFMLVLAVPAPVLDALTAINLFISALLISLSLYVTSLTAFSTFPVVLLLSTLFRLDISVATTRLLVLDGHAGPIVDTFGNFVVRGDVM